MITPRKIRELPAATEAHDDDVFPVSQMIDDTPQTKGITRAHLMADIIAAVAEARDGLVQEFAARDASLQEMLDTVQAALTANQAMDDQMQAALTALQTPIQWANIQGKPSVFAPATHTHAGLATLVGTATISQTATLAISAGVRKVSVAVDGVVTGGNYLAFPTSATPTGYGIMDVICTANGTLQVSLTAPLLAIGASYSIPIRVVRINT